MSNICAGIGRGQMEVLQDHVDRRREIHKLYGELLKDVAGVTLKEAPDKDFKSNYWLSCILVDPATGKTPADVMHHLSDANIESRLLWRPMHIQPVFAANPFYGDGTSERLFNLGLCLPSGSSLSDEDIIKVVENIKECL